ATRLPGVCLSTLQRSPHLRQNLTAKNAWALIAPHWVNYPFYGGTPYANTTALAPLPTGHAASDLPPPGLRPTGRRPAIVSPAPRRLPGAGDQRTPGASIGHG